VFRVFGERIECIGVIVFTLAGSGKSDYFKAAQKCPCLRRGFGRQADASLSPADQAGNAL